MPRPDFFNQAKYDADNKTCAEIILADPDAYGGPHAGVVRWARMVMEKRRAAQAQKDKG